jgi:phosphate transport system substrate-binding protein
MKKMMIALPLAALTAACGGGQSDGKGAGGELTAVGSSTVYPFTTAVAEQFMKDNPGVRVVVESTGTGGGIKLFCGGVGESFPDMVNASRALKASEYETCAKNGVKNVIEVPIGIDGLTFIESKSSQGLDLTVDDIYKALAANPFGKGANTAKTWKDVNPALPAIAIRVMGPPPTSGTRDSLADLILIKGCESDPAMKELKKSDEDKHKEICTGIRTDGAYVEAGENDNLLVQKVSNEPGTIGVLGFSFLEENADKVKPVALKGVMPTTATITDLSYPGSRKLYVYVKGEHLAAKPRLKDFIAAFAAMWGPGGVLEQRGLVPFAGADADAAKGQASALKPLDPATLK